MEELSKKEFYESYASKKNKDDIKEPPQKDSKTDFAHQQGGVCKFSRRLLAFYYFKVL